MAVKLLSQNWPIDSRALFWSAGKTWAWRAAIGSCGKGDISVCADCIVCPFVSLTEMPCSMGNLLVHVFFGSMKWLVHIESTMNWLLSDGLRAGTRVLQECKHFKTK